MTSRAVVIPSAARNPAALRELGRLPRRCAPRNDRRVRRARTHGQTSLRLACPWYPKRCRHAYLAAVLVPLLLAGGCREQPVAEPNSISDTVERGPFVFTVEVTPRQAWVGDPITIALRVQTPDDHVVRFPNEEDFGELGVRSVESADPRPGAEGGLVWRQTVTAESLTSGTIEIPALVVKYARKPEQADATPVFEHELATGPLEIGVRSALTTQDSVVKPRDITGVLTPPKEPLSPWTWAAIAGAALIGALLIAAFVVWLKRRAQRPAPPILPEVWALRALAQLEAADLIETGQAREFYYRLSEIVRVYIELKFGLAAPEMTTEEFLLALAHDRGAVPYDADRLRDFLQACDLVKYAALRPRTEDATQALSTARAFIDATAASAQQRAHDVGVRGVRQERGGYAA